MEPGEEAIAGEDFFTIFDVIARLDRAIQYAAAVVMDLDVSGILDAPLAGHDGYRDS
jgi:hypothetical protein